MADDIYKSRYTAEQIDAALTIVMSIAGNAGVPVGTGDGSIKIIAMDTDKLSALDGRIPSSAAVYRAVEASRTVSRLMTFKGIVDLIDDLPADAETGDTWQVTSASTCYSWTGKTWLDAGDLCIIGPPGDKGDAFTYDDFTPEQLAALVGPKGDTPKKVLDVVSYQAGDSGTTVPTGAWWASIPDVQKGKYLWTRRVQQWDTGDAVTDYSVSYFGTDGSGSVNTVCGVSPDAAGNVPVTAQNVGAVPTSGGTMTGNLSLPAPSEAAHAVNKAYVDTTAVALSLPGSGWAGDSAPYTQTVTVEGLTDGRRVMVYPAYGDDTDTNLAMRESCACISYAKRSGSNVTITCLEDKPAVDVSIIVEMYV